MIVQATSNQAADMLSAAICLFHAKEEMFMTKISSGLKTLFLVHFAFGLVFGLIYLFIPGMFMSWFGMPVQDEFPYRIIGSAILALTASSWYCYQVAEWERVKIVVLAEIAWTVLNVIVGLYGVIFAGLPAGEWTNIIIMAGFAAAFIYFYFRK
jgi:hypothetical protein